MPRNPRLAASPRDIQLSIVVPLFNEAATIAELHRRLNAVLLLLGTGAEIVYVDDGSSDGTRAALEALAVRDERIVFVPLARNYGQTAALAAGFDPAGGAGIAEVPIANIPGPQNQSHYGLSRTWRVMADLITVRFLLRYVTRPLHLFGPIGIGATAIGALAALWVLATKVLTGAAVFLAHGPLLLLSAVLIQTGVMLIGLGLLAEVLTRIYMDGRHRRIYTIASWTERPAIQPWPRPSPVIVQSGGARQ